MVTAGNVFPQARQLVRQNGTAFQQDAARQKDTSSPSGAAQPGAAQPDTVQQGVAPAALSLPEAMTLAMQHNPSLIAARLGRAVSAAEINVARERPNPDFTLEGERETP